MKNLCSSFDELPVVLSIAQTAEILGVSCSRAFALTRAGVVPSFRIGERTVVPRAALLTWLETMTGQSIG